jgi:hypothetical protein
MQVFFEPEDPNDMSVPHVARLVVDGLILGETVGADDATALANLIKQLHENTSHRTSSCRSWEPSERIDSGRQRADSWEEPPRAD